MLNFDVSTRGAIDAVTKRTIAWARQRQQCRVVILMDFRNPVRHATCIVMILRRFAVSALAFPVWSVLFTVRVRGA